MTGRQLVVNKSVWLLPANVPSSDKSCDRCEFCHRGHSTAGFDSCSGGECSCKTSQPSGAALPVQVGERFVPTVDHTETSTMRVWCL